jgi:hypothetical protein
VVFAHGSPAHIQCLACNGLAQERYKAFIPLARVQHGKTDDFITLIADDQIVIGHFTIRSMTGLLLIDVQCVGFGIVCQAYGMLRRLINSGNEL